jgi:hypothetical protein
MTTALTSSQLDAVLRGEPVPWGAFDASPSELVHACAAREISGLVHERLEQSATGADWPPDVREGLARAARAATAAALVTAREIAAVLTALSSSGIDPVLLKGVPLAYGVYDAPGSRAHADTDLLVRRDQVDEVRRVMAGLGYVEPPLSDGELVFCQFQMMREDRFGIRHLFDVHWKISTQTLFADVLTFEELAEAAEPVPALGPHARAAGPVHALLLACIHPAMHHRNSERLIWLYDVHLLMNSLSTADAEQFAAMAVGKQVAAICLHQLTVTRARFHTAIPDRLMRMLAEPGAEPSATYLKPGRRWEHEFGSNVRGLTRWRDRLRLVREVTLPGPRYMLGAYGVGPRAAVLLPALYVHRCVRGAWRIVRRRK